MSRTLIERRLRDNAERLKAVNDELRAAEEQLAHFDEDADEARLKALMSETPMAEREHHEARRHAEAMRRHRDSLLDEIRGLEESQNELLDRLVARTP